MLYQVFSTPTLPTFTPTPHAFYSLSWPAVHVYRKRGRSTQLMHFMHGTYPSLIFLPLICDLCTCVLYLVSVHVKEVGNSGFGVFNERRFWRHATGFSVLVVNGVGSECASHLLHRPVTQDELDAFQRLQDRIEEELEQHGQCRCLTLAH